MSQLTWPWAKYPANSDGGHPWQGQGQYGTEWSLGGYIAEVIGVDGSFGTAEEISALDAYFKGKYGLPF